jgi:hypothetical protein
MQLLKGVLFESAQKNFKLLFKHFKLKKQLMIRGKRKNGRNTELNSQMQFSKFN